MRVKSFTVKLGVETRPFEDQWNEKIGLKRQRKDKSEQMKCHRGVTSIIKVLHAMSYRKAGRGVREKNAGSSEAGVKPSLFTGAIIFLRNPFLIES